ncbi:hypothetical protein HAP94_07850 [Acidithiobacillus ferrivorans]|nr:hypothetical protein [Acidithiobacillus ferrivorans]
MMLIETKSAASVFSDLSSLIKTAGVPVMSYAMLRDDRILATNGVTDVDIPAGFLEKDHHKGQHLLPIVSISRVCHAVESAESQIRFTMQNNEIAIALASGEIRLKTISPEAFPLSSDGPQEAVAATVGSVDKFIDSLNYVEHVIKSSHKDPRHYVNGLFVETFVEGIRLTAMDGHRLAHCESGNVIGKAVWNGIVPRNSIDALKTRLKRVKDKGALLSISGTDVLAKFSYCDETLSSRLISGEYPAWRKLLNVQNDFVLTTSTQEMLQALDLCMIAQPETKNDWVVIMTLSKNRIHLSGVGEFGNVEYTVPAKYAGAKIIISCNGQHLMDAISSNLENSEDGLIDILHAGSKDRGVRLWASGRPENFCLFMPRGENN